MGNCSKKIQQVFQKKRTSQSKIGESTTCPRCGQLFPPNTTYSSLNFHVDTCLVNQNQYNQYIQQQILQQANNGNEQTTNTENNQVEYFWAKVPIKGSEQVDTQSRLNQDQSPSSSRKTSSGSASSKYRWERRSYSKQDININQLRRLSPQDVSSFSFEKKQVWFREKCELMRIPWTQGADWVRINPDNVLLNSMLSIQHCDLHKVFFNSLIYKF